MFSRALFTSTIFPASRCASMSVLPSPSLSLLSSFGHSRLLSLSCFFMAATVGAAKLLLYIACSLASVVAGVSVAASCCPPCSPFFASAMYPDASSSVISLRRSIGCVSSLFSVSVPSQMNAIIACGSLRDGATVMIVVTNSSLPSTKNCCPIMSRASLLLSITSSF